MKGRSPPPRQVCSYPFAGQMDNGGHFTQVVWASTRSIGCAMASPASCPNGIKNPYNGNKVSTNAYVLICEYDPPGVEIV